MLKCLIAYDTKNSKLLIYEKYHGSLAYIKLLDFRFGQAQRYKNIGFIIDRGYFRKENIWKVEAVMKSNNTMEELSHS